MPNQHLAEELHKRIIRKFEKRKVHSSFMDNFQGADLADMQLISKFNKRFQFLLCVTDIYSKYAWVVPLKDKKGITISNASQKILDGWIKWVEKGSEFYNRPMKSQLQDNDIEMYSSHNKGKFVLAERFIRTLKKKIYKYRLQYQTMCILVNQMTQLIDTTKHIIAQLK